MKKSFLILICLFFISHFSLGVSLDGVWKTSCVNGQQKIQVIKKDHVSAFEVFYKDYQCQKISFYFLNQGIIEAKVINSSTRNSFYQGIIDFNFESVNLNIFNDSIEFQFNQQKQCGYDDWRIKKIKNITGLQCQFFSTSKLTQVPRVNDKRYGIFKLEDKKLSFGKLDPSHNAMSPQTRPIEFDSWFFEKN